MYYISVNHILIVHVMLKYIFLVLIKVKQELSLI